MDFSYEIVINSIFYIGCLQGIILSIFLFNAKTNVISNRLFGLLTLSWAIVLLVFALQSYGLFRHFPHLLKTFSHIEFVWFPLLFLSIKYLLNSHDKFKKMDLLHFTPLLFNILLYSGFYIKSSAEKIELLSANRGFYYVANEISYEILSLQGIVYSILGLTMINYYRRNVIDFQSNIDIKILKALRIGVILSLIAWTIGIFGNILEGASIEIGFDLFQFVYLFFVAIIYIISFMAIRSPEIYKLMENRNDALYMTLSKPKNKITNNLNEEFQVSDILIKEMDLEMQLNETLIKFMESSKPYLDPDLSLQSLAKSLDVSRHQLSSAINTIQKVNFYEFVNSYRVNEVVKLLENVENRNKKNYDLAFDAGFNSRASFYRIFKQVMGQTPSDYRRAIN